MKRLSSFITIFLIAITSNVYSQSEFSEDFISIGVVVSDINQSLKFYKDIIGMTETGGFTVNSEMGKSTVRLRV